MNEFTIFFLGTFNGLFLAGMLYLVFRWLSREPDYPELFRMKKK